MEDKKVEQFYSPPPKLSKWEGFKVFLWNSETGQFLGRTGASWAKILLFYVIFYAVLTGFFGAMLTVFYQTLDPNAPKWQLENSLIGSNPGLGFRPMPPESNVDSTLIWYKASDEGNFLHWTRELDKFLEEYQKPASPSNEKKRVPCDYGKAAPPSKVCDVDISTWGQCTKKNKYGYNKSAPCIFLKLNKIFGWQPKYYNDTKNLPSNMPSDLQDHIKQEESENRLNTVWVSCSGENPADVENMGAIQYIPRRGFPGYYFPFTNTPGYLSPLVAVFFERPKYGVLINIECKAWAQNIIHDRFERRGSVHFELMVD
ncbi:Sodium/potassium-transporting ATPase subunit beta-2 [Eufriesea mexicana]|uniref:Sodium/potassium-transporting ATPase subunit beta-2 n=1 Tax=Eufriesea mexicana TaxID=516756 RepID=A0A310SHK5_9HYME|nr:PREDICTED: sodium/potassium-transporting ATPase subunit beta-2-like [Eufriesea mexicana]OAD53765.1 Sodium/potassium-transporting ATPase subunit beta-2 [Eufriesea mexicana]